MADLVLSIRLTADGKGLVGEVRGSAEALKKLREETGRGASEAENLNNRQKNLGESLGRMRSQALAAVGAITSVALSFSSIVRAGIEAEQSSLRLEAVLRATGFAAGLSKGQLDEMAESMKRATGIDDDQIRQSMAVLLTFRQVQRESFGEALAVAANLSKVIGTDLRSGVLQLGKALEDPITGLTALTRSGVSFNETQKNMIKGLVDTGRQGAAITLILKTMKEQGLDQVAESMNRGLFKSANDVALAWDDMLKVLARSGPILDVVNVALELTRRTLAAIQFIAEEFSNEGSFSGPRVGKIGGSRAPLSPKDFGGQSEQDIRVAQLRATLADAQAGGAKQFAAQLERNEALRKLDIAGWVEHADTVFNEAFELYTDLAKISTTYWEKEDKLREEGMQAYFRIIDQDREREEIALRLIAGFDEEGNAIKKVDGAAEKLGFTFASAFEDAIVGGEKLRNMLQGLAQDILRIFVRRRVTEPLAGALASAFSGAFTGGTGGGTYDYSAEGFQHGGEFTVPGAGGIDSQLVRFRATPGERVRVETPQQQGRSSGATFYVDMRGASLEAVARLEAFVRRIDATLERRAVTATFDAQMRGARP